MLVIEMVRVALLTCGAEYSGVYNEIQKAAKMVGAEIVIPEVDFDVIRDVEDDFGISVKGGDLKLMMARAKSISEGWSDVDAAFIATCFRCADGALVRNAVRKYLQDAKIPVVAYSFTEKSKAGNFLLRMEALVNIVERKNLLARTKHSGLTVGLDSGSTTTKAVIMRDNEIIGAAWRHTVDIIDTAEKVLNEALQMAGVKLSEVEALGTTGYGRFLIAKHFNADIIQDEITVGAKGATFLADTQKGDATIIDIGGMDNKAITVHDSIPDTFTLGGICAGSSGRFLETTARRLGVDIKEFGEMAARGDFRKVMMNSYCIVFGMQDLTTALAAGAKAEDVAAAACRSVVDQIMEQQLQEITLRQPIIEVGGTSLLKGLVKAVREALGMDVIVPKYSQFAVATGMAFVASGVREEEVYEVSNRISR
ncbi:MAG: methanogenesis marker 15 protein [Archaeoglobaceae archaeon]